jgi:citrate lyase beta subunit
MGRTLSPEALRAFSARLEPAHKKFRERYPGAANSRQPLHTYYEAAHLFNSDTLFRLGDLAIESLEKYAPDFNSFAKILGLPGSKHLPESTDELASMVALIEANPRRASGANRPMWLAHTVYSRVLEKLRREPVEDFRIDFEDGYGNRSDDDEDRHALSVAKDLASAMKASPKFPSAGIRIKPFSRELHLRSVRTLDLFLTELSARMQGAFPSRFLITLAKVYAPDEVAALADVCSDLESDLGLADGTLKIELMIETTQSILNEKGEVNLLPLAEAAGGRCVGLHFGTYDYTAGRNLTAVNQHMLHYSCDFAREIMQVATAGTGIWVSDGGTNILPVAPHSANSGRALTASQIAENSSAVHCAWKIHFDHVRHSLANGFYQGWDLHPAQLPTRHAAVISFFLENLDITSERLRNFIAANSVIGQVSDDAATGQGLLNYFRRAIYSGAVSIDEAERMTGLTSKELREGSFAETLRARRR